MDKKIEESKLFRIKMFLILGTVALLILSLFLFRSQNIEPQINYSTIYIDEIQEQISEEELLIVPPTQLSKTDLSGTWICTTSISDGTTTEEEWIFNIDGTTLIVDAPVVTSGYYTIDNNTINVTYTSMVVNNIPLSDINNKLRIELKKLTPQSLDFSSNSPQSNLIANSICIHPE